MVGANQTVNFAFVDSGRFFSAIHEYYPKFGYTSSKHCLEGQRASIEDECEDPERTVYYMGAHPSRQTHRILAEYVASVLKKCWASDDKRYIRPRHCWYDIDHISIDLTDFFLITEAH
jgi:phospholipase/lecithinase/hemolysin